MCFNFYFWSDFTCIFVVFFTGTLRNVQCALHIGDADNLDSFVGEIEGVSIV